jgi:glutamate formiminotransferase/formiminotetrahydrofolate cyclodeaminase
MPLVECVPNFSEGRDPAVIAAIRDAIAGVAGVHVLDVSSDVSHHRSVITFVAPLATAVEAAFAGIAAATARIDLTAHAGAHPRLGATDVVPFIPLDGATMDDCISLAHELGERVATQLAIPVYFYERAARSSARQNLADVRRGEFEGIRDSIAVDDTRIPDCGPRAVHPTAGAIAIGARPFLVAYNVYLGPAHNLPVAQAVARAVRGSSGGLRFVKAMGLEVDGQAQVSMNLVDTEQTPLHRVFEMVRGEAAAHGVTPTWSELVGLVPERCLLEAGARHVQLRDYAPAMLLERRVRDLAAGGESLDGFVARVASPSPTPGGGSVAAHAGALGAALAQMVAGLTVGRRKYAAVEEEARAIAAEAARLRRTLAQLAVRDAASFDAVRAAYQLAGDTGDAAERRREAIREALFQAADVPLETARAAAQVCALAARVARVGNRNAVSDAAVAALLADAACRGAVWNVRINVHALAGEGVDLQPGSRAARLLTEARALLEAAAADARAAEQEAEASVSPAAP